MSLSKKDLIACLLLSLLSILTVFDLFVNTGVPATMDGLIHIITIEQFTQALRSGDFPVRWLDNFANYGLPLGSVVHQLPSYLGAIFNFLVQDPVLAFSIVSFIGILFSTFFYYVFLRFYTTIPLAFLGAFIFNLAPYRIINLYIRGAIPETFSAIFPPLIMIGLYLLIKKKDNRAFFLLFVSFFGLILSHPMMLVVYAFLIGLYFLYLLFTEQEERKGFWWSRLINKRSIAVGVAFILAFGMSSYYILPLLLETKYFYYGSEENHLVQNQFMTLRNFFDPFWYYYTQSEIFTRGHVIKAGLPETVIWVAGVISVIINRIKTGFKAPVNLLEYAVITGAVIIFFMLAVSENLYTLVPILGNIQFPWRFFSAFMFISPLILVILLHKVRYQLLIVVGVVILFAILRFPQLYGKNYTNYPLSYYGFTAENLHSTSLNTIWTGETESYPIKKVQSEIISGKGEITSYDIGNSERLYKVRGDTPLKLVDYTFYFPGWRVYVDGQEAPIQFQDPNYRGVITYEVPQGEHTIIADFTETKVRLLGNLLSICFLTVVAGLFIFRKKVYSFIG